MDKRERCIFTDEIKTVKYAKRYGYWWKIWKKEAKQIKNYSPSVDYFGHLEYKLDKPVSKKHFERWMR